MEHEKICKKCLERITGDRAKYNQTRYCTGCARTMKRINSEDARLPAEKKAYMNKYMSAYREKHPELKAVNARYVKKYRQKRKAEKAKTAETAATNREDRSGTTFYSFVWILGLLTLNAVSQEPHSTLQDWYGVFETTVFFIELVVFRLCSLLVFVWFSYSHVKKHMCEPTGNRKAQHDQKPPENKELSEPAAPEKTA